MESGEKKPNLIFVVDDEPDILEMIGINLQKSGYQVEKFTEGQPMLDRLERKIPQLIILDLMLPDIDGMEVCKTIKKDLNYAHVPIIMVTAKGEEVDIVLGLEFGADDYIPKPFSPRELVARVKAVLRRVDSIKSQDVQKIIIADTIEINPEKFEVLVNEKKISLTTTEFNILKILAEKQGWVFSREKILDLLWADEKDVFDRTIDVHIKNLRDKLGIAGKFIKNIRGVGYKLET
jgi:two-component system phosphate regulon response regulator PhoB/two-component system alkaline phosphatase synthesis response regulator PhoP